MDNDIKRKIFIAMLTLLMMVGLVFGGYRAGAADTGAGSVSDPLITKSYLDSRLNELDTGSASFVKVTVTKGQKFTAADGAEFFMYSGAGEISGGSFVDISSGDVFTTGNTMVKYNLFVAVTDGSSIRVSSQAVFYVKGSYTVE